MASISFYNESGLDVMFVVRDEDHLFANTSSEAMESYNAANIGDYAIVANETGATGEYVGVLPTWLTANKRYTIQAAIVADAESPAESDWADSRFAVASYWWDGANLFPDWAIKTIGAASPMADSPEAIVADVLATMPTVSEITDDIDANSELLGQVAEDVAGLDGAAIPSLADICNASDFTGAFPAAILANAPRNDMVLSATSLARGPEAALTDADIPITVFKNGSPRLTARVYLNGEGILQADVASITYSIYELTGKPDERIAVAGHTDVSLNPSDVLFNTMQSDAQSSRYNFKHQVQVSEHPAFTIAGRNYLVEVKINPVDGEVLIVRWRCDCI